MTLRTLVVDDTILFRKIVGDALAEVEGVSVVGTASNGKTALARMTELKPDLVTLDIDMPEMNGIEVLEQIRQRRIDVGVIVVSALTRKGSQMTIRALELGAFDFITKPSEGSVELNRAAVKAALAPMIKAFARRREIKTILGAPQPAAAQPALPKPAKRIDAAQALDQVAQRMTQITAATRPELIVIGLSTGGPNALAQMLPAIPGDLNLPILIVQHMPPLFTQSLAESLNAKCTLTVKEAQDGEVIRANHVYIAPGGKQMKLLPTPEGGKLIRITDDPPENNCKPAVDYLFRSVANSFPGKAAAVIMTGMGNDGTVGLRLMKRGGSVVIAQDEASCVVFGMPREAILAGVVDVVVPLDHIADEILKTVRGYTV